MATDKPRKTDILTPLRESEFWRINGIAEATEKRLQAAGIHTFAQLADSSIEEIAAALQGQVGVKERAARQDWTGQARKLAEALAKADPPAADPPAVEEQVERQHYETFLVELLLDDERHVRRTRVSQVRGGQKYGWPGWDPTRLMTWIAGQARLSTDRAAAVQGSRREIDGTHLMHEETIKAVDTGRTKRFFDQDQPLELHLPVDMTVTNFGQHDAATLHILIEARQLESGAQTTIGELHSVWDGEPQKVLVIPLQPMEEGTYRLIMTMKIYPEGSLQPEIEGIHAFREGGLVHIYGPVPVIG